MKILLVHLSIKGKRAWGRVFPLSREFAKLGHSVTILTTSKKKSLKPNINWEDDVKIISFPDLLPTNILSKGFGFISLFYRIFYAALNRFDLVITDNALKPSSGIPAFIQKFFYKTIYISEWWDIYGLGGHFDNKPYLIRRFYGSLFTKIEIITRKKASGVTVLTKKMYDRAIDNGISLEKIELVPGGSLVDILKPKRNFSPVEKQDSSKIIFGFIGMGDGEIEDINPFLEALPQTISSNSNMSISLHYFGTKFSDRILSKFNLDNNIIKQHGWVDYYSDISLLQNVDIFILIKKDTNISNYGWPNKLGDYLSLGKPVLINPYGDVKDFIEKYPSGFITTNWDKNSIQAAIKKILKNEYNLIEMGRMNREVAVNACSWKNRAERIIRLYKRIK